LSGTVAPATPVSHRAWAAARRALIEAHAGERRLAALLGPPGIGKTFLLAELDRHFRGAGYQVERIAHGDLLTGEEAAPILLVDEADRLDDAALRALAARGQGFVLLAALPGFAARLESWDVAAVRLGPLEPGEVASYVAGRLAAMGLPPNRFEAAAVPALAAASGGVPRLLNTLMGNSAFTADMEGEARVTARHVAAAAALRADVSPLPPTAAPGPLAHATAPAPLPPGSIAGAGRLPRRWPQGPWPPASPCRRWFRPPRHAAAAACPGLASGSWRHWRSALPPPGRGCVPSRMGRRRPMPPPPSALRPRRRSRSRA
jgi:hypothetical protein